MLFSLHVALLTGVLNKAAGLNWTYFFSVWFIPLEIKLIRILNCKIMKIGLCYKIVY